MVKHSSRDAFGRFFLIHCVYDDVGEYLCKKNCVWTKYHFIIIVYYACPLSTRHIDELRKPYLFRLFLKSGLHICLSGQKQKFSSALICRTSACEIFKYKNLHNQKGLLIITFSEKGTAKVCSKANGFGRVIIQVKMLFNCIIQVISLYNTNLEFQVQTGNWFWD